MDYINHYREITKDCPFNTDPSETFFYAEQEHLDTNLLARQAIEIDIASAFPSLCKFLLGENHIFVQKIFEHEDKFERNKFIAINLTHKDYDINLKTLNAYCKFIILGYIYNNFDNVNIIEYKKDGALFTGTYKYDEANKEFNEYIEETIGIEFHIDRVDLYIRFNKTSVFKYGDKISVKGKYKEPPLFLMEKILPTILNNDFDVKVLELVKFHFSDLYYEILTAANLGQELSYYYKFNKKFIQRDGELEFTPANPKNILIHFLYPIMAMLRLEK
jgi:hypothetical protein